MALNYQIVETTELEPLVVRERILAVLQRKKYRILNSREQEIDFDSGFLLKMKWRHEPSQLSEGIFQIRSENNLTTVQLDYVIFYWYSLLMVIVPILIGVFDDPFAFFVAGFVILAICFEFFKLKTEAKDLIAVCKS